MKALTKFGTIAASSLLISCGGGGSTNAMGENNDTSNASPESNVTMTYNANESNLVFTGMQSEQISKFDVICIDKDGNKLLNERIDVSTQNISDVTLEFEYDLSGVNLPAGTVLRCDAISSNGETLASGSIKTEEPTETPTETPENIPLTVQFDTNPLEIRKSGEVIFDVAKLTGDAPNATYTLVNLDDNSSEELTLDENGKISAFFAPQDGLTQNYELRLTASDENPETGIDEAKKVVKPITVLDPTCTQTPVEYADVIPDDPQIGDTFTPENPTFVGDGNTTLYVDGNVTEAGVPVGLTEAGDVNYTVRTNILPTVDGCAIQTKTNTSILKVSTPLLLENVNVSPVDTLYSDVNISNDTYYVNKADLNNSVSFDVIGDGNITTDIFVEDENGTRLFFDGQGNLLLSAGQNYSVQVNAAEGGDTPKTSETATVEAGKITQPLPEIATPSISNSSSSSSTKSTRTVTVPEGLRLVVDGQDKGEGIVTFTVGTGSHTAQFVNGVGRPGDTDPFSHTYYNPDRDGDGLTNSDEINTYKTNPDNRDTDGDGLYDGQEVKTHGTNPLKVDTDGDGVDDKSEIENGTNPLVKDQEIL